MIGPRVNEAELVAAVGVSLDRPGIAGIRVYCQALNIAIIPELPTSVVNALDSSLAGRL